MLIVQHHYPALAKAERKIARFIMNNPGEASNLSSQELADITQTSEATVFRFCKSIGYTYSQLKSELRLLPANAQLFMPHEKQVDSVPALFEQTWRILAQTLVTIDSEVVQQTVSAMRSAQRIDVCGMGSVSGKIAELAAFKLNVVGKTSLSWVDNRIYGLLCLQPSDNNVVVGVSHSGENVDVARTLTKLGEAGATTVAITNYPLSPVAKSAHLALITGMAERQIDQLRFTPRLASLALIEYISEQLAEEVNPSRNIHRINKR